MFEGIITALVTPFSDGQVDYSSLAQLVRHQLDQGIDGFVVHGTTAESPTTTLKEKEKIFELVKSEVANEVPLIIGTGTNSTADTVENSKLAEKWGADGILVVVPYYNKPPQRGLLEHFNLVASSVGIPTILYNVPGRTITSLEKETIVALSENKQIVAIKEASGDVAFGESLVKSCRADFHILSGDDKTCMELAAKGGRGVISVVSHVVSKKMREIYRNIKSGHMEYLKSYEALYGVVDSMYIEANPIPVKYALEKLEIIKSREMRLPLVSIRNDLMAQVDRELERVGL